MGQSLVSCEGLDWRNNTGTGATLEVFSGSLARELGGGEMVIRLVVRT